jgi:hypothetical protein
MPCIVASTFFVSNVNLKTVAATTIIPQDAGFSNFLFTDAWVRFTTKTGTGTKPTAAIKIAGGAPVTFSLSINDDAGVGQMDYFLRQTSDLYLVQLNASALVFDLTVASTKTASVASVYVRGIII